MYVFHGKNSHEHKNSILCRTADWVGLNHWAPLPRCYDRRWPSPSLFLSAARMTANLQSYLRMEDLSNHFTMHSLRVGGSLSKSLAGTAVDEIMKIGGWKIESVAKYCIGATSSGQVRGSKKKRGQSYADASELPLSPEFRKDFVACSGKD